MENNNVTFILDNFFIDKKISSSYTDIFNNKILLSNKKISSPIACLTPCPMTSRKSYHDSSFELSSIASLRSSPIASLRSSSIARLRSSPIASIKSSFYQDDYCNDNSSSDILVSNNYLLKKNRSLSCDSLLNYNISKKITTRYIYNKKIILNENRIK